jgi:hypothetical protein
MRRCCRGKSELDRRARRLINSHEIEDEARRAKNITGWICAAA